MYLSIFLKRFTMVITFKIAKKHKWYFKNYRKVNKVIKDERKIIVAQIIAFRILRNKDNNNLNEDNDI